MKETVKSYALNPMQAPKRIPRRAVEIEKEKEENRKNVVQTEKYFKILFSFL